MCIRDRLSTSLICTVAIYFFKKGKGREPNKYYSTSSFKFKELQPIIGFLHIFTGCDTTSCFYRQGKKKLISSFEPEKLKELASKFYKKDATAEEIASSAYILIRDLYSNKAEKYLFAKNENFTLNDLRYLHFSKAKIKTNFAFETLPPTEGAAKQHAFRVYYQLQLWLSNCLNPTQWGWKVAKNHLVPIGTTDEPLPENLLKQISCGCKTGCNFTSCTCRKHGLQCSDLCANCTEIMCSNIPVEDICVEEDENENENQLENNLDEVSCELDDDCENENECMNNSDVSSEEEVPLKKRRT